MIRFVYLGMKMNEWNSTYTWRHRIYDISKSKSEVTFFIYYLPATWPAFVTVCGGSSLSNPMIITFVWYLFELKVTGSLLTRFWSQGLAKSECNILTH